VGEAWIRGEQGSSRGGGVNVGFAEGFIPREQWQSS
jgi:hypothetical protein